jgi:DHA1 family bicyclomycin/chloramphenicol resistance-like MFS transporter
MSGAMVVWFLSLLLGLQPITTDLYLPALPALREGFGASMAQAQLTLTGLLLAFGCSQLLWGPLSDRFGRRPVLLWGMAAYVVASIGSAAAPSMSQLLGWRMLQGAAMGAGVVCARAIVRDLYSPRFGAQAMSRGLSGLGVIACLSPSLGGLLAGQFGWRVALLALAVFGALTLMLLVWRFVETLPAANPKALLPRTLVSTWWRIAGNPTFRAYSLLSCCSYAGLFTYLAASSFVFIRVLGLSPTQYGLVMLANSLAYFGGTFGARRLLGAVSVRRAVGLAGGVSLLAGTSMGLLAQLGVQTVAAIQVPMLLFMIGHSVHQSCGQSGAVAPFPQAAGAASALNGFLMMLVAFLMGGWLGVNMDDAAAALVNGIWFWSVGIALCAWTVVQWHGEPGA